MKSMVIITAIILAFAGFAFTNPKQFVPQNEKSTSLVWVFMGDNTGDENTPSEYEEFNENDPQHTCNALTDELVCKITAPADPYITNIPDLSAGNVRTEETYSTEYRDE